MINAVGEHSRGTVEGMSESVQGRYAVLVLWYMTATRWGIRVNDPKLCNQRRPGKYMRGSFRTVIDSLRLSGVESATARAQ